MGLAVTDSPASLGTEMLAFSANAQVNPLAARKQSPENLFTAAAETVFEFEDQAEKISLFSKVSELLGLAQLKNKADFSDVNKAVEAVATAVVGEQAEREKVKTEFNNQIGELTKQLSAQQDAFNELKGQLAKEPEHQFTRTPATGGENIITTDC